MLRFLGWQGGNRRTHLRGKWCDRIAISPVTGQLLPAYVRWNDSER